MTLQEAGKLLTQINKLAKDAIKSDDYNIGMAWHGYRITKRSHDAVRRKKAELEQLFKRLPGSDRLRDAVAYLFAVVAVDHHERDYQVLNKAAGWVEYHNTVAALRQAVSLTPRGEIA